MPDTMNIRLSGAGFYCILSKSVGLFFWHMIKSPVDRSESFEACCQALLCEPRTVFTLGLV